MASKALIANPSEPVIAPTSNRSSAGGSSTPLVADRAAPLRVLHVLSVSVPHLNGYAVRSQYIVKTQRSTGRAHPIVVTSPFYPGNAASIRDENIDGIDHYRIAHPVDINGSASLIDTLCRRLHRSRMALRTTGPRWRNAMRVVVRKPKQMFRRLQRIAWRLTSRAGQQAESNRTPSALPALPARGSSRSLLSIRAWLRRVQWVLEGAEELCLMHRFRRELLRIVVQTQPDIIHAHSPYRCGQAAIDIARRCGIPVVYEVRGVWEDSGVAEGNFTIDSAKYRFWRNSETATMQRCDAVITICRQLRDEIAGRGVPTERIFICPNAVDSQRFTPIAPDTVPRSSDFEKLRARLGGMTLGYIGSIRKLEGVDETIRGAAALVARGYDVSLLIVGDGPGLEQLKLLAEELDLADRTIFTGRVPHDVVRELYALLDVFVVSRPALRVTQLVTPLKPLEAMAMGKALLVSDLPALRELVCDGETGLLYRPGDIDHFADQCARFADEPQLRARCSIAARAWVSSERTWHASLEPVDRAYRQVLQAAAKGAS